MLCSTSAKNFLERNPSSTPNLVCVRRQSAITSATLRNSFGISFAMRDRFRGKSKTLHLTQCAKLKRAIQQRLCVEIRERQSPDWRIARRHSGEWRSRGDVAKFEAKPSGCPSRVIRIRSPWPYLSDRRRRVRGRENGHRPTCRRHKHRKGKPELASGRAF